FFYCSRPHRLLHSFPTRRSSDLPDHDNVTSSWFLRAMLPALVPALARPVWDEFRDVAVKLGHRLVEAGEPGSAGPRELSQVGVRSEEHTSELQSLAYLVCRLLLE